ncbi:hypothetical protein BKA59DRAFT_506112 [Fusarium tricinctum]|uniref:Uncharacterized protein n=1 Tax=Fusarium tricinctum TaxID=61284 RepID=A0A8K0SB58_9HYPO|nr:hypothetical protein BKA59DRAFT_506112 [Fusarium tricinctum]
MPDFRPLFFIAKVLTCCCYRRKSSKPEAQNQPYQRSGMPQSLGLLHHPDVFADVQIHDDAGVNSAAPGSLQNDGRNLK